MKQIGGDDPSLDKNNILRNQPSSDPFEPAKDVSKKSFIIKEAKEISEDEDSGKAGEVKANKLDGEWDDFSDQIDGDSDLESE